MDLYGLSWFGTGRQRSRVPATFRCCLSRLVRRWWRQFSFLWRTDPERSGSNMDDKAPARPSSGCFDLRIASLAARWKLFPSLFGAVVVANSYIQFLGAHRRIGQPSWQSRVDFTTTLTSLLASCSVLLVLPFFQPRVFVLSPEWPQPVLP